MIDTFNRFLVRSTRAVPIYFYVFVPLILRKAGLPVALVLASVMFSFAYLWWVKWKAYQGKPNGRKRYIVDVAAMILGLGVLYGVEICVYRGTDTINLALYFLAYLTYIPALLSTRGASTKY